MRFGPCPTLEAAGSILAHKTKAGDKTFKKGHRLTGADCEQLMQAGFQELTVARTEPGDVLEDPAADRLARAAMAGGLTGEDAFTGRVNLYAATDGLLVVNPAAINAANRIDPAITFATLENHTSVAEGRMVATAKIISFAVPETALKEAEVAVAKAVSVVPFQAQKVGLVATELPHLKTSTMDKTRRVLEQRLQLSGSHILAEKRVPHDTSAVADAIADLKDSGAELLILFGASAVVDRQDVLPSAIDRAGGTVKHLGMPVDPGNLLMLADVNGTPAIGAPGCARSPKENGFDWVLERLLAGLTVTSEDITGMGVGGLLMEIGSRPQPRERSKPVARPRIAAIILGAGKSSRMGGPNKLLAQLDGKSLIRHVAEATVQSGVETAMLVTGHRGDEVAAEVEDLPVVRVHNPDYADGMAGSIRTGVNALRAGIDAVFILLGDMPSITSDHLKALIGTYQAEAGPKIVIATANGKRGNPVLWDKGFFGALKSLSGDIGARHVIADNLELVAEVEIGAPARMDLDTPEALTAAGGRVANGSTSD
ncbi:4-diphosphocytidyl-2C-methyl-D-erythritol kinase [Roseibium denhamense]|uniref:Molybdopterin molybdochelatase /molybdenum cofactor cytidylyltransferase n=1 Tax=Roseibium denhamense TaxID=76305 RepID=A0ABY1PME0_9HYPH|nr:molybdopterin-binding/glycosyltransferase family 2 protein [Roseibium denhamense]MTI05922.1 4-diphosphocytidyl-2C-methyl-D-erythritol kinase [Roseibium denhamense]SMP35822.1 molybdopterin molybdochelatase /molybdenum cofactor cytidylyltransferase [Roseibium denhamense]